MLNLTDSTAGPLLVNTLTTCQSTVDGLTIDFMPVALHCYTIARNLLRGT